MSIRYLAYKDIDKKKWDACIRESFNGLIYAEAVYLDHMSPGWDAIVLNDYEVVMPLTWRRKWNIKYLYQPAFIQQGGIFSKYKISPDLLNSFINEAFKEFRFAEITLNHENTSIPRSKELKLTLRNNYILQLGSGYQTIFKKYNSYIRQRLNRLKKFSLQYVQSNDCAEAVKLYRKLYNGRMTSLSAKDYSQFEQLCAHYVKEGRVVIRKVFSVDGKELLALIMLLKDERRLYNMVSCILPQGKKLLANYFLYNELIREFAGVNVILDFEGSDIPGVSYFYNKFAGGNQQYPFLKFNRLPLPVRFLKR